MRARSLASGLTFAAVLLLFTHQHPPPAPLPWTHLGFLRLWEVEDLAVGLPQVLLLLEVHLKRPFDGHKGDASLCTTRERWGALLDRLKHVLSIGSIHLW